MKKIKQPGDNISIKTKKNEAPAVMEWINSQSNLVDSIRYLIENEIRVNGVRNLQHVIPSHRPDPVPGEAAETALRQPIGGERWAAAQELAAARSQNAPAAARHEALPRHYAGQQVPPSYTVQASEIQEQHAGSSTQYRETHGVIPGDTQYYENQKNLNPQQNYHTPSDHSHESGIRSGHEPEDSSELEDNRSIVSDSNKENKLAEGTGQINEEVQPPATEPAAEEKEFVPDHEDEPSEVEVPEEKPEPEIEEDEIDEEDIKSWL